MLPKETEYLFILAIMFFVTVALLGPTWQRVFAKRTTWTTFLIFFLLSTALDYYAINHGWWTFPPDKVVGLYLFTIPLEEYILFALFGTITLGFWEITTNDLG